MSIVLPFAEKFAVEEVSGDMLFPRSLATTGICTYSRKSPGLYLAVVEPAMRTNFSANGNTIDIFFLFPRIQLFKC
jgi:hypothetical protein